MTDRPLTEQEVDLIIEGELPEDLQALKADWLRLRQRLAEVERERDELFHTLNEQNRPLEKENT